MPHQTIAADAALYLADETAWLDLASELVRERRFDAIDPDSLAEYLSDMAKRDRREVNSRLVVLLIHVLKWYAQPDKRTGNWLGTIMEQSRELNDLFRSRVLRNHAEERLAELYLQTVGQAAAETRLTRDAFPAECPYTVDQLLSPDIVSDVDLA